MFLELVVAAYLVVHLGLYLGFLRHFSALKREGGIASYHFGSYALLVSALLAFACVRGEAEAWMGLVFGAAVHGLYSLSFLELWALTHRSYSLSILAQIEEAGGEVAARDLTGLQGIGSVKRAIRTDSLRRLGLFVTRGDAGALTPAGYAAATLLAAINWLSNGRPIN